MFTRMIGGACLRATGWIFVGAGVIYLLAALVMPLHGLERSIEPVLGGAAGIAGGSMLLYFARRVMNVESAK